MSVLTNVLKPNLPNKMKQGAMKSIGEPLPQGKPESTNKKTGGFFKPTVKRKASVLGTDMTKTRTFSHFADFRPVANFYNLTGNLYLDEDYLDDDELIRMSPAEILARERNKANKERTNRVRESANARAEYRAGLDTVREVRSTLKSGRDIIEPIGAIIKNTGSL